MMAGPKVLDAVALLADIPEKGLVRGQVGTAVMAFAGDVFEVEFSDDDGKAFAVTAIPAKQLLVLRYQRSLAA